MAAAASIRAGLASLDLDTGEVEPWTSVVQGPPFDPIIELATDGTWLFARTEGTLNGNDARFFKIDPVTGAIAAERAFPSITTRMRVAGGEILVSTQSRSTFAAELGVITIADWSYAARPVTFDGSVSSLDAIGDTIYLAGRFSTVTGQSRPAFAAVHRVTGAVLPWRPAADAAGGSVRAAGGRVWVAGDFRRVGGQRRRGLAELDPTTGLALPWNPDVAGVLSGGALIPGVNAIEIGVDGNLYAVLGVFIYSGERAVAAGQLAPPTLAYSTTTGRRLPWRPSAPGMIAVQPDCLLTAAGCLPRAIPAPTDLQVDAVGRRALAHLEPAGVTFPHRRASRGGERRWSSRSVHARSAGQSAGVLGDGAARAAISRGCVPWLAWPPASTTPDVSFAVKALPPPRSISPRSATDRASSSPGSRPRRARRHATNSRPAPPKAVATSAQSGLPEPPRR